MMFRANSLSAASLALTIAISGNAFAATFSVNSTVDEVDADIADGICQTAKNECTLRAAIQQSNALAGKDIVDIPAGTYAITIAPLAAPSDGDSNGDFNITDSVEIRGAGKDQTIIDGNSLSSVFRIFGDDLKFDEPLLRDYGHHLVYFDFKNIAIRNAVENGISAEFFHSWQQYYAIRTLVISVLDSSIMATQAKRELSYRYDAGIYASGHVKLQLSNCDISDNAGSGVYFENGEYFELSNSLIARNRARGLYFSRNNINGLFDEFYYEYYDGKANYTARDRDGSVKIIDSTITENSVPGNFFARGGGISVFNANGVFINRSEITNNSAVDGGGISVVAGNGVVISDSVISGNRASTSGGGLFTQANLYLNNTRITGNSASNGGGIYAASQPHIENSDIDNNVALANGGGMYLRYDYPSAASQHIFNTRIVNNRADSTAGLGGGIFISVTGRNPAKFSNVSLIGNQAFNGDNIYHLTGNVELTNATISKTGVSSSANIVAHNIIDTAKFSVTNSIIHSDSGSSNCDGVIVSGGGNMANDSSCSLSQSTDQIPVDPLLANYDDNSHTRPLTENSPAIGSAVAGSCPATDQSYRGRNGVCDIGAVEFAGVARNAGTISWKANSVTGEEGAEISLTIQRTGGSDGAVGVWYSPPINSDVLDVTDAPNDRTPFDDSLVNKYREYWADGDITDKTVKIKIQDDKYRELEETYRVTLFNPSGGAIVGASDEIKIVIPENDPYLGSIVISSYLRDYKWESQGPFVVKVKRKDGFEKPISVKYETIDGEAKAGVDYEAVFGTLEWADGDSAEKEIRINIVDDNKRKPGGKFSFRLFDATGGATIAEASGVATLTIWEDDPVPNTIKFLQTNYEINENNASAGVVLRRDIRTNDRALTLQYSKTSGTAQVGEDFSDETGSVTFELGKEFATITVNLIDDAEVDPNESFTITVADPDGNASFSGTNTVTIAIVDNDTAPTATYAETQVSTTNGSEPNSPVTNGSASNSVVVEERMPETVSPTTTEPEKKRWFSGVDYTLLTLLLFTSFTFGVRNRYVR